MKTNIIPLKIKQLMETEEINKMNDIKFITPYHSSGILFKAYEEAFKNEPDDQWICFLDGDVAFLEMANFGHIIKEYIEAYPDTGIFTCYASRCHYEFQRRRGTDPNNDSLKYWAAQALKCRKELHLKVKPVNRRIAGHLILIKKSTWTAIQPKLLKRLELKPKKILGFDTQLSYAVMESGFDIKLMRGILIFHYLRALTGKNELIK